MPGRRGRPQGLGLAQLRRLSSHSSMLLISERPSTSLQAQLFLSPAVPGWRRARWLYARPLERGLDRHYRLAESASTRRAGAWFQRSVARHTQRSDSSFEMLSCSRATPFAPRWVSVRCRTGVRLLSTSGVRPPFKVLMMGADAFSCATLEALHGAREGESGC